VRGMLRRYLDRGRASFRAVSVSQYRVPEGVSRTVRYGTVAKKMEAAYHLVRFEGYLDISRYPEFRAAFEGVPHAVPVLVDLTLVKSVDSTFLTETLLLKRRHTAKMAILIAPAGHVARIFEIADIGAKMDVYSDLSAAVAALGFGRKADTASEEVSAD